MSRRLVLGLIAAVLALIGVTSGPGTAAALPTTHVPMYAYDAPHHHGPAGHTESEHGLPTTYDYAFTDNAVDHPSHGDLAHLGTAAIGPTSPYTTTERYHYDTTAQPVRSDNFETITQGRVQEVSGTPLRLQRSQAAANTARVFTSADTHVADAANLIERAVPGRVVGVNTQARMSNGLSREVDIDLGDLIVQVKSGNARGLIGQLLATTSSTCRTAIGYAPGIPEGAWLNAAREGVPIARTPDELLAIIRELG